MFRDNRLKRAIAAGGQCNGAWLFSGSAAVGEILALHGFDALIIDQEHSPHGAESTIAQMRAIAAGGRSTILVRVADIRPESLKLALDSGAEGIVAPKVDSAEEARALVSACRYPPTGTRGAHYTVSRAARWGHSAGDYLERYARELLVIAMIESEAGLRAAADIAAVDGIDMLFFGPLDLSASFGCLGDFADPRVIEAIETLPERVARCGKWAGSTTLPGFSAAELFARGYRFVTTGSDVTFLHAGAVASLELTSPTR
jgi:4-hydroxy-2-oxoheptanedioate aldolase